MTEAAPALESVIILGVPSSKEEITVDDFCGEAPPEQPYWFHLSIDNPVACTWLKEKSGVDPLIVESMVSRKVRPRAVIQGDSLLLILRVADTLDAEDHEELRSLRIYTDGNRVISASLYPLPVVKELLESWKEQKGESAKVVNLFMDITSRSVRGLESILEDLEDQADLLERQVLDVNEAPDDSDIATLALDALDLRRCLAPQREVISRLADARLTWLGTPNKERLKHIHERVSRQLDETEVIRDRARIIREQRDSHVAGQVNQRLYIFSVVAVLFLPLSFLTGLLGVNLGGIPGAESTLGFLGFCGLLAFLTIFMLLIFKWLKWL